MATNRDLFEQLLDKYEPEVRAAFIQSLDQIKGRVDRRVMAAIVAELRRGNIEAAIDLLGIDRAAFAALELAIADTFNRGGIVLAGEIVARGATGARLPVNFGVRNLVAEALLREYSATQVTRITEDARESLRIGLSESLARGDNPTRMASDMIGRQSRANGNRVGGYLGLDAVQERTQANARSALLSGDPEGIRNYLMLKSRDRRFDPSIRKALAEGRGLAPDDVTRIISQLNARQLRVRANRVALHETFTALSMAKNEGIRQAIESGKVDVRDVTKTWGRTISEHPRTQHLAMRGQTVAFNESFVAPDGTLIPYPHAPGIPARHSIGCNCPVTYRIDYTAALIRRRAINA